MPDEAYHFPPDLIELLIDTIPLLCRSKADVLGFFRGCGVARGTLADLEQRVDADRAAISKYQIARTILTRINETGDRSLGQRRQVIKRVTEFQDYSACWSEDQLKSARPGGGYPRACQRERHLHPAEPGTGQRSAAAHAPAGSGRTGQECLSRRAGEFAAQASALKAMDQPRQRGLAFEDVHLQA